MGYALEKREKSGEGGVGVEVGGAVQGQTIVGRQAGVRYAINSNTRRTAQDISISMRCVAGGVAFLLKVKTTTTRTTKTTTTTTERETTFFLLFLILLFADLEGRTFICVCDLALGMRLMASTNAWDAT